MQAYFEAISTNEPDRIREALPLTVPGSNANAYVVYYAALQQSFIEANLEDAPLIASPTEDGFERCPITVTEEDPCLFYTNIQYEDDKITDFDVNEKPLDGRITLANGEGKSLGEIADLQQIASTESEAGYVIGVFEIISKSEDLDLWVTYLAPDGEEYELVAWAGSETIPTGSPGTYSFWFEGVDFGGAIKVGGSVDGGYEMIFAEFATK